MTTQETRIDWLSPQEVSTIWDELSPIFQKVVDKAVHGEYDVEDIYSLALKGEAVIGVIRVDGKILMVLAYELQYYPKALAVNVLAMGGEGLYKVIDWFLPSFANYCRGIGAKWIECGVSPGMERMHLRNGLRTVYRNMRYDL